MSSWRARIGKLSPSRGDNYVHEFYQLAPPDVLLTVVVATVKRLTPDNFSRAFQLYEEGAATLREEGADVLVFGGGPVFVNQPAGTEDAFAARVAGMTGLPVVTEYGSAVEACRALGIRRLGLVSPYLPRLNEQTRDYFVGRGLEMPVVRGLGVERNIDIGNLPLAASYDLTMQAFREDEEVDGYYITCPRWRVAAHIDRLERETGKFILTSTQTSAWSAFSSIGLHDRIEGFGRLLSSGVVKEAEAA